MEGNSEERKRKQSYLKREILDANYDKGEFAEFMMGQKPDGLNVDNWEETELMMVVDEFVRTHTPLPVEYDEGYGEESPHESQDVSPAYGHGEYLDTEEIEGDMYPDDGSQEPQSQIDSYQEHTDPNFQHPHGYQEPASQVAQPSEFNNPDNIPNPVGEIPASNAPPKAEIVNPEQEAQRQHEEAKRQEEAKIQDEQEAHMKALQLEQYRKDEKHIQEKLQLEGQLQEAFHNETMFAPSKNFADMKPKYTMDYGIKMGDFEGVKLFKTRLNHEKDLKIVISDPEVVDEGFFVGKHLSFKVEVQPLSWAVHRRDKDFNILRDYLVKAFPHLVIPAAPEFNAYKSMDKSMIKKREHLLNRFMNKLMIQKDLRACPAVLDFVSYEDSKAFTKQLKQSLESAPKLKFVSEFPTSTGIHKVHITKQVEMLCNQFEKYVNSHECLFKKFHFLGRKLSSDLMEVAKTLDALSFCSNNISTMYKIGNSDDMGDLYGNLSDHFKKWSKDMHNEAKINLKHIPQYFNYTSSEYEGYKNLFNNRNKFIERFLTKSNDLQVKKEKLFKSGKPEKWYLRDEDMKRSMDLLNDKTEALRVMLPDQTQEVMNYEIAYTYVSNQCYSEIKKFNSHEIKDLYSHFKEYTAKMNEVFEQEQKNLSYFIGTLHSKPSDHPEEDHKVDI
ncbi:unnamed protein product [Moneuplotes crassus]|uniref:PX domain-containing protein n=1 Tax=Euplotes crassus TaxID=5936 RepID=A0AAD1U1Q6_EUPCR|nr:unnamed protein product [Moneuplotes crassus]